jgi:hypothetical protein
MLPKIFLWLAIIAFLAAIVLAGHADISTDSISTILSDASQAP